MRLMIQYLEPGPHIGEISAAQAACRLRSALVRAPLDAVIIGWDLPKALVEACAEEASRAGAALYLWHPLLTAQGAPPGWEKWRVVGPEGVPIAAHLGLPEFAFLCPRRAEVRALVCERLEAALDEGPYAGVMLDRVRYPSPLRDGAGCFCPVCRAAAVREGVDLERARRRAPARGGTPQAPHIPEDGGAMAGWRARAVTDAVEEAARHIRARGLKVGLDLWSASLARCVGQDLTSLGALADWAKVMLYGHTWGPAGLPYERAALPGEDAERLRREGIAPATLAEELARARERLSCRVWAGVDLVEIPGVCERSEAQVRAEVPALRPAEGLVLSWDLWRMPLERLSWCS